MNTASLARFMACWRSWPAADGETIDQIAQVLDQIKQNPDSRRLIVSAWNVGEIPKMALPPCHLLFQFYVAQGKLSCQLYQRERHLYRRSVQHRQLCIADAHGRAAMRPDVGDFVWTGGDCHIYSNHFDQVREQLSRTPRPYPRLVIKRRPQSLFDYRYEDFEIEAYDPHPHIKAAVAV